MGKISNYDFGGYATKNDLVCTDGRTIRRDAFAACDGKKVPLVWNHKHDDSQQVLGHAVLENRADGVYAYCKLNNTAAGQNARELVKNGDIDSMSIWANNLKQKAGDVLHGVIKEVSLVLAGANPGALIDDVMIHGEGHEYGEYPDYGWFYQELPFELSHSDEEEKSEDKEDSETIEHADAEKEKSVEDVIKTMNEDQKTVLYALVAKAAKSENDNEENEENSEGGKDMKHNVFEGTNENDVLQHDAMNAIIGDAKRYGSMKESFLAHKATYGIEEINWLFPEDHQLTNTPGFIKRTPDAWVGIVMNGVHKTPFSRIKMMFADITADEARAKGYTKGKRKTEEVFTLLKRSVSPTTIYKKQKLDRDDIIDITDFDVVSWIKGEMRMMLEEEMARAFLVGDGRLSSSDDKINESNIIPIAKDDDLYALKFEVKPESGETFEHAFIVQTVKAQDDYQGSGNLTLFVEAPVVTGMLLMEDKDGRRLYNNITDVANALNVDKIVKLPKGILPSDIYGIAVDLKDYNVGADKGGAVNMFDDFDIDYNQQKYLMETRCSGALVKPYSALVFKKPAGSSSGAGTP